MLFLTRLLFNQNRTYLVKLSRIVRMNLKSKAQLNPKNLFNKPVKLQK